MEKLVKVTVLKAFPLKGIIVATGVREVPESKVERLVSLKVIAPPEESGQSAVAGANLDATLGRIGAALSLERREGEDTNSFLSRLADHAEGAPGGDKSTETGGTDKATLSGALPDDFPARVVLSENGINTFEELLKLKTRDELIALKGIGEKFAGQIAEETNRLMKAAQSKQ